MTPKALPQLRTDRLVIRHLSEVPAQNMIQYFKNNQAHFLQTDPRRPPGFLTPNYHESQREKSKIEFNADQSARLVLFQQKQDSLPVGTANLTQISRGPLQACYLGYGIDHAHEGQGFMHEALTAVIQYAFSELNLHRIMADHLIENHRSEKLLKRLGFITEGIAKNFLLINGQWRDHVLNSLTNPHWKEMSES